MLDIIQSINNLLDNVDFVNLDEEQRKWLREQFNTYARFEYTKH